GKMKRRQMGKRWISRIFTFCKLFPVECFIIVGSRGYQGKVPWIEGLDQHLPGLVSPPGTTHHLTDELKSSLCPPEVGKIQGRIRRNHPDQGNSGKVMSLGNHLGSDEYIRLTAFKLFQDPRISTPAARRIPVHTRDTCFGKQGRNLFFQTFGPLSEKTYLAAAALRAQ